MLVSISFYSSKTNKELFNNDGSPCSFVADFDNYKSKVGDHLNFARIEPFVEKFMIWEGNECFGSYMRIERVKC